MRKESITARVRRGAAWLDKNQPGWALKIDRVRLDLGRSDCCILGQVYGHFWPAVHLAVRPGPELYKREEIWAERRGFLAYLGESYLELTEAWDMAVIERRTDVEEVRG